jgi:hypothetical protein
MRAPLFLLAVAALAAATACREPPGPGDVLIPVIAAGNAQVDTVGHMLPLPIAVRVNDGSGRIVYGLTVVFRATTGAGTVTPETVTTRGGGLAQARWTLGNVSTDTQRVNASVLDPRTGAEVGAVQFRAIATADRPQEMNKVEGDNQTADLGAALPQLIGVRLRDRYGNGVPGVLVNWSGDATSGSPNPAQSASDGAGIARTSWTLGLSLGATLRMRASTSLGTVTFSAVPRLPATVRLETLSDSQTTMFGTGLPTPVGVRVSLPSGANVRGAVVTFAVTSGGGSITPSQVTTDTGGVAVASWVVGATPGANTATVTTGTKTVGLTAFGVSPELVAVSDSQTAIAGSPLPESLGVRLQVPSQYGYSVVPGVSVTFAVTSGGGSITPSQAVTDDYGVARVRWVLGSAPGKNTATATFGSQVVNLTAQAIQPVGVAAIATGGAHSCAITLSGVTYCWGDNTWGQLGDGSLTTRTAPVLVVGGPAFTALAGGAGHTCGLDAAGAARCWGNNATGQLGDGTRLARLTPTPVQGTPPLTSIVLGRAHTCGLTGAGAAWCWGDNTFGQLGDSSTAVRSGPVAVVGSLVFTQLAAGDDHTCGITTGGTAYCWGLNGYRQLGSGGNTCTFPTPGGTGTTLCGIAPTRVTTALTFSDVGAQYQHTCALSGGTVYCWGEGDMSLAPVPLSPAFVRLGTGGACALTSLGQAFCWDVYSDYYYGYGRVVTPASAVAGSLGFGTLSVNAYHYCAIGVAGQSYAYCWGENYAGQVGDGSTVWRSRPTPVALTGP